MSRPHSPRQFVLDEDDHSQSSATESLLTHHYPPEPHSLADEDKPHASDPTPPLVITIPSVHAVNLARTHPKPRPSHSRLVVIGLVGLLAFAYFSTQFLALFTRFNGDPHVQVILMISDGMGPASETLARTYLAHRAANNSVTPLDSILVGSSRTRSTNSLITDSAAGATAFSCLEKTFNGAIAVTPAKTPCGTILESAHHQKFSTGIVTTSRLTHATPAAFYSHVVDRDLESDIARFLVGTGPQGQTVDLAFGGGQCFFVPNSTTGSCRNDRDDLLSGLKGVRLVEGMKGLRDWKDEDVDERLAKKEAVIGFFANDHMDYEIDRKQTTVLTDEQPSLKEITVHALKYLKRKGEKGKGFFLMIEGARIDMAAHNNDPIGHLHDILAYYETVEYVKEWVRHENEIEGTPTVMVSVSDHETGGLALGRQLSDVYPEYLWYPEVLENATHSTSFLGKQVADKYPDTTREWVQKEIYEKGLGIFDVATREIDQLWIARRDAYKANRVLADAVSRRAQIGWSTAGHSGVDVNLYAYGHNSTGLNGCIENTQVGEFIAHTMAIVTLELNKGSESWFSPKSGHAVNRTQAFKHYEGDF
ncbi:alkaline phosphatase PHO8 [Sporobolomyces koalae]|uniref:alkaline phosphatase PHO8 n=1 Tax=Sporobolomyces koalae TaxID=500713 RepID=UPI003181D350